MAGAQVIIMANQVEDQRLGKQAISLTHYDDNLEPQIAAGSVVEIGSALFEFSALESITGWAGISNNSDVYIKLTVSGASVTASFTIAAPTWDTAKQGWYSGAERYIAYLRKDGSGLYTRKLLLLLPGKESLPAERLRIAFTAESGANVVFAADRLRSIPTSTSYARYKTIAMPFAGTVSVAFDLRSTVDGVPAYGKVYQNAVAIGTERSTTSTSFQTYTEDIAVSRGDTLELHAKANTAGELRNFRIRISTDSTGTILQLLTGPIEN